MTSDRAMFDGPGVVAVAAGGEVFTRSASRSLIYAHRSRDSAIYRLGIEAPPNAHIGALHQREGHVKRAGVTVRANRKSTSASAAPIEAPIADQLRAAVQYGGIDVAVPIRVASTARRELTSDACRSA